MEPREGKILEFLKNNANRDLEIPDIAVNVKKSEKTVEAALLKLQQKGLVTSRRNEHGQVYWYALPSAPETKSLKAKDVYSKEKHSLKSVIQSENEVDIEDLKNTQTSKDKTKNNNVYLPSEKPHTALPESDVSSEKTELSGKEKIPFDPEQPSVPESSEQVDRNNDTDSNTHEQIADSHLLLTKKRSSAPYSNVPTNNKPPILTIVFGIGVLMISVISLIRSGNLSEKIRNLENMAKSYVTVEDLKLLQDKTEKIKSLEGDMVLLTAKIDSLKKVITYFSAEMSTNQKTPLKHRRTKKR